jgi:hypothetical protein
MRILLGPEASVQTTCWSSRTTTSRTGRFILRARRLRDRRDRRVHPELPSYRPSRCEFGLVISRIERQGQEPSPFRHPDYRQDPEGDGFADHAAPIPACRCGDLPQASSRRLRNGAKAFGSPQHTNNDQLLLRARDHPGHPRVRQDHPGEAEIRSK